jgi:hypothetical protein
MVITSNKNDNLDSILEKIKSGKNLDEKINIYSMFRITHAHYTKVLNVSLQIWEPELWKIIKRSFYPSLWQKILNKFK